MISNLASGSSRVPSYPGPCVPRFHGACKDDDARTGEHPRQVILLDGCVQPTLTPATDAAAIRVFDRLEIGVIRAGGGCCGAVSQHLAAPGEAQRLLAKKLDTLQQGVPDLVATANVGCQTHLQTAARLPVVHWIQLFDPQRSWPNFERAA